MNILTRISTFGFAAISALSLLTSCGSAEEPKGPKEIEFYSNVGVHLSRDENTSTPLSSGDYTLRVTGLYHTNTSTSYYFQDEAFLYRGASQRWRSNTSLYYPFDGTLDFVGYAATKKSLLPEVTYYMSGPETDNSSFLNRMDLDFTTGTNTLEGFDKALVSTVAHDIQCGTEEHEPVPLDFYHILSNVRFTFAAESQEAENFLQITGLEIRSAATSGICRLTREANDQPWKVEWPELSNYVPIKYPKVSFFPVFNDPDDPNATPRPLPTFDFYLPGQDITSADGKRTIKFRILFKYKSNVQDETGEMVYMFRSLSISPTLEPGHRYTYKIICSLLPHVEFQVSLVEDANGPYLDEWQENNINM